MSYHVMEHDTMPDLAPPPPEDPPRVPGPRRRHAAQAPPPALGAAFGAAQVISGSQNVSRPRPEAVKRGLDPSRVSSPRDELAPRRSPPLRRGLAASACTPSHVHLCGCPGTKPPHSRLGHHCYFSHQHRNSTCVNLSVLIP